MFQFSLFAYEKVFRENINIQPKKGNLFQQLYSKERRILKLNLNIMKNLMIYYLYILLISSSRISKTCDKFTSLQYLGNILNIAILVSQIGRLPFPKTSYPIDFIRVFMLSQAVKKKGLFFLFQIFESDYILCHLSTAWIVYYGKVVLHVKEFCPPLT